MNGRMLTDFAAGLTPHLPLALAVVSLLLAIGGVALVFVRSPAHRQRVGELTLAAALGWLVLAAIPLPRWLPVAGDANHSDVIAHEDKGALAHAIRHNVDESAPQFIRHGSVTLDPATEPGSSAPEVSPIDVSAAELNSDTSSSVAAAPHVVELTAVDSKAYDSNSAAARGAPSSISSAPKANESEHGGTNRWVRAVSFAYLMGVALAGFWLLLGHALLLRERFTAAAPPAWLYRLLHNSVSRWEGRLPRLIVSRRSSRPLSWGVWQPIICLPERICHTANRDQLRTILLHELGHIHRCDARGNLLFELAFPLLFFHPLYWWLRSQVRMAAELVADDWAAGQTGKETYVAQLVALARGSGRRRLLMAGTGLFSSPSQFYRRMQMLLARENPLVTRPSKLWRITSATGLVIAIAITAALAGNRPAAGQQTDQPAKEPPKPVATDTPKAETTPVSTSVIAEAPKNDTAPVAIEVAPTAAAGALPATKDVPARSAASATAPVATTPAAPTALASDTVPASAGSASDDAATAAHLQAEKAKLLDEIQALRAKLHAIEAAKTAAGGIAAYPAALPPAEKATLSADRLVILTRADEKGQIHEEVWTTDENGRPSRIVKQTKMPGDSPIAAATPGISDGDHVVKMLKDKDGRIWIHMYDAKTGKLIETKEMRVPPDAPVDPTQAYPTPNAGQPANGLPGTDATSAAKYPPLAARLWQLRGQAQEAAAATKYSPDVSNGSNNYPPPATTVWEAGKSRSAPIMVARTPDGASASVSDRPIDLVTLATSYADAVGAVEVAKAKLAEAESGGQSGELRSRRAALESAVRKEKLLRRIAEVATNGAKQNYERLVKLHGQGAVSADMLEESKSRLDILSQILDTRADSAPEGGSSQPK